MFSEYLSKCCLCHPPCYVYPGRHPLWELQPVRQTWTPFPEAWLAIINQAVQIVCFVLKWTSANVCVISCCPQTLSETVTWSEAFSCCPGCWGISRFMKDISKGAAPSSSAQHKCHAAKRECFCKWNEVTWLLWGFRVLHACSPHWAKAPSLMLLVAACLW